jgi:hypothetical protein
LVITTSTPDRPVFGSTSTGMPRDLDRAVLVQQDLDPVAEAAEGLVDRVVDDLPQAVHQAAAVGGPDVHARPLADGLQALEDEQVPSGVVGPVVFGQQGGRH